MADAIGIATGIIEFIKIGKKVLDLCEKIKNVPQKIIEQQHQLTETVQFFEGHAEAFELNTSQNNANTFLCDRKLADGVIERCAEQLKDLERILNGIAGQLDGGRTRRAWAAICAVKRDAELQDSFDHLQLDLNKLSSILSRQSFLLLKSQSLTNSSIESRQIKIYDKVESIESVVTNLASQSQIAARRLIDNALAQDMRMMKLEKIYDMTTEMASPNFLTRCDSLEEFPPLPAFYIQDHIQSASKCKCERRPKTLFWSLGLLNFRDKRGHQQDCPLYGTSEREVNVALQLAVPFIFAKSVQVVFKANWGAGGFAISPGVELKAIMVDRSQSPAFLCLDKLQKDYRRVWVEDPGRSERAALAYCQSVLLQLRTVLQKSPQSVREQDENGATILWEFVTGIGRECWWFPPQNVIFTPTVTEYVSRVIKMMVVDYGADPNTVIQ
ncbi:hypothetical protein IWX47DRAFT_904936 [Phyllosticta citricarpa]